mmetsp:Transcript_7495/g.6640  ORF Transcript_7495/g.6640 Transcript_7495/m.6640 type:complete len:165 (-) Transcript_7495:37-531(-)
MRINSCNKLLISWLNKIVKINKASDDHMKILNQRLDTILSQKPIESRLPGDDPIANEVIFEKMSFKIRDLEDELTRMKSKNTTLSNNPNSHRDPNHPNNLKMIGKKAKSSRRKMRNKRGSTSIKENHTHNGKKLSKLNLKKLVKNNRGILKQKYPTNTLISTGL